MRWKIHTKQRVYDGHFKVDKYELSHEKYNGDTTPVLHRELVKRSNAVAVLPYDPVTDEIVLIEQFRVGALGESRPWLQEIVAGLVDEGESSEEVACRESEEEIGCRPAELIKIAGFYPSPGGLSEWVDLYLGRIAIKDINASGGLDHEGEDIRVFRQPARAILGMVENGEIRSAIAIIAIQWFAANRSSIRKQWTN